MDQDVRRGPTQGDALTYVFGANIAGIPDRVWAIVVPFLQAELTKMMPTTGDAIVLYSSLGDDPDLGSLVTLFVEEIPDRISALEREFEAANWEAVQRLAHQMKGAAGSYGFEQITPYAYRLEMAARRRDDHLELRAARDEFIGICQRIRAGVQPS